MLCYKTSNISKSIDKHLKDMYNVIYREHNLYESVFYGHIDVFVANFDIA